MNSGSFARPLPRCLLFKKHRETPSEPTVPPNSDPFMAEVVAQLEKQLESERKELAYARLKIQVLEEQLRQQRIAQYGPGSEKLSNLQLELLDEEPAVSRDEVQAESEREPGAPPPAHIGQEATYTASWPPELAGAFAARGKGGRVCALAVCLHLPRRRDNGDRL